MIPGNARKSRNTVGAHVSGNLIILEFANVENIGNKRRPNKTGDQSNASSKILNMGAIASNSTRWNSVRWDQDLQENMKSNFGNIYYGNSIFKKALMGI